MSRGDYPQPGERWRNLSTGDVVEITTVGKLGSTWFKYVADGRTGRALHSAFLPGRRQEYERVEVV